MSYLAPLLSGATLLVAAIAWLMWLGTPGVNTTLATAIAFSGASVALFRAGRS